MKICVGCNLSFTKSLNTSYFEMDVFKYFLLWNGWIILLRLYVIKDFATSFRSLTLDAVNLLLWREILSHSSKLLQ